MMRLYYHDSALADIEDILDFVEARNPAAAIRLGEGVLTTCELLEAHPELGERRDDLRMGLRVFSHRGYGIYYEIDEEYNRVNVSRVLHPRVNVTPKMFE